MLELVVIYRFTIQFWIFLFVCGLFCPQNISSIHPSQMGYIHKGTFETANKLAIILLQLKIITNSAILG
jgi:hypothetical protein